MDLLTGLINGVALGSVPFFLNLMGITSDLILWLTLLVISYVISFGSNSLLQITLCKSFNPGTIAKISAFLPGFVGFFLAISYIGFLRWAVEGLLPQDMNDSTKVFISRSFWIFWGAFYGQTISGGFAQSCT